MSVDAVGWALKFDDLPADKRTGEASSSCASVLIVLAYHASPGGTDSFPSVDTIRRGTKLTERTVRYALRALEEYGTIRPTPDPVVRDERIADPRKRPQSYDIIRFAEKVASESNADPGGQTLNSGGQTQGGKLSPGGQSAACQGGKLDGDFAPERSLNKPPNQNPSSSAAADAATDKAPRDDVEQLCVVLREGMIANECKEPTVGKRWRDAARLLLDRDKRPLDEALDILAWSQADEFWHTNIHSMPKFRAQYDALRLRWKQTNPVRHLRSDDAIKHWLRDQWHKAHVKEIEVRSGLRYTQPDLPEGINTVDEARKFHASAARTWINDNHQQIVDLIQQREQPVAS